jgi:hypothetical protein
MIIVFLLINFYILPKTKLPLIIDSQEDIFRKIAYQISQKLPQEIDILIFRLMTVNADITTSEKINNNFKLILKTQQYIYKYSLDFIDDVIRDPKYKDYAISTSDVSSDYSFIDNYDETELLSYAKYLKKDAILIATITIMDESKKGIWDNNSKKITEKKVGLIQGNILYSESGESLIRFSYYFIVD